MTQPPASSVSWEYVSTLVLTVSLRDNNDEVYYRMTVSKSQADSMKVLLAQCMVCGQMKDPTIMEILETEPKKLLVFTPCVDGQERLPSLNYGKAEITMQIPNMPSHATYTSVKIPKLSLAPCVLDVKLIDSQIGILRVRKGTTVIVTGTSNPDMVVETYK